MGQHCLGPALRFAPILYIFSKLHVPLQVWQQMGCCDYYYIDRCFSHPARQDRQLWAWDIVVVRECQTQYGFTFYHFLFTARWRMTQR